MAIQETTAALADPLRRRVMDLLEQGGMEAGRLAEKLGMTPSKLSYHLRKLKEADLIVGHKQGTRVIYELNLSVLDSTIQWLYRLRTSTSDKRSVSEPRTVSKETGSTSVSES
ncbi:MULTISPECIES: metalloregulator ArsR/SmtB family transcription factor [Bifidobacterium]|uniref:metalloregulator ArsR/SmtB family transcription factor n=1 Tax=Bifidobacterium TaxID=1678 RepID=UPI0018DD803E|nr:metalloregulator ArsR/SmtB family transcription factor [Bifidobacterium choladohabitans]MBI0048242.1 winged helix-turn-helix transcriptional regulator [Bifidobacterium choladohabitans]